MATQPVVVVSGGGGDIGGAICRRLAAEGWSLVVCDQDMEAATRCVDVVRDTGGAAHAECVDALDAQQMDGMFTRLAEEHGRIGALINSVGISGAVQRLPDYPEDAFEQIMRVNVHSVFLGMRAVLPLMHAADSGVIVNLASTSSIRARANLAGYVASKHAVLGLTKVAALEAVGTGVRVNAVLPGPVETRMIQQINEGNRGLSGAPAGGGEVKRAAAAPYGSVDDVAATVAYLVSADACHVNGAEWVLDGGSTLA